MNNKDILVSFEDENEIVIKLENKTFLNLQKKTIAPSTEEQTIRSDSGYEGLKEVIIQAVTSAIDNNIISSNIKKNITILGVEGTLEPVLQSKSASPSTSDQVITPDENYDGLSSVSIRGMHLELFSITPRTYNQTLTPSQNYDAIGRVTINKVTAEIDSNITPENIKNGVTILGVQGTFDTPEYEGSYEITANGTYTTSGKKMTQDLVVNVEDTGYKFVQGNVETFESNIPTRVRAYAFYLMSTLTSVSLPSVTSILESAFYQCSNLVNVNIPNVETISNYAFRFCSKIETLDFNSLRSIGASAFGGCSKLTSLTIRTNQVCSLSSTGSIPATSSQHITIYVPSNLVDSYKTATNWSTLYNNGYIDILAISE